MTTTLSIINYQTNSFILDASITSFVINTTGAISGIPFKFTLRIFQDNVGSRTIVWPANVRWPNGNTPPTLSTGANKLDVINFESYDGGVTIFGYVAGLDMRVATAIIPATFLQPFNSSSPWNTAIKGTATYMLSSDARVIKLRSLGGSINCATKSHPIYQALATDVNYTVHSNLTSTPIDLRWQIPVGAQAALPMWDVTGNTFTDAYMHVLQPDGKTLHESWQMRNYNPSNITDGSWSNSYHVQTDISGSGIGQGGVRAYGGSAIGGLIRSWEIAVGLIRHPLAMALDVTQIVTGPVWPATAQNASISNYSGNIPMGSLVAIPKATNLSALGLTSLGLIIATALQDYGAYIVDTGAPCMLYVEPTQGTDAVAVAKTSSVDMASIVNQLTIITNNSSTNVGGGP